KRQLDRIRPILVRNRGRRLRLGGRHRPTATPAKSMRIRGVRVFYTLQDIFDHVLRSKSTETGLLSASNLFGPATKEAVSLASSLGWLACDRTGYIHPTDAGLAAHPSGARSLRLR